MSITVSLDTSGLDHLIRGLGSETDKVIEQTAENIVRKAKERAPVRTCRLRASIHQEKGAITVGAPYAAIVEARKPFLAPVLAESEGDLEKALEAAVRRLGGR